MMTKHFSFHLRTVIPTGVNAAPGILSYYPSVRWKLQNIAKLKSSNPTKHEEWALRNWSIISIGISLNTWHKNR